MILLPLMAIVLLLINPGLEWYFGRSGTSQRKLIFWLPITTGLAWVAGLAFFLARPLVLFHPVPAIAASSLPPLGLALDATSSVYALLILSQVFFLILSEWISIRDKSWISVIGAVCLLGALADTAYTLALVWAVLESLALIFRLYGSRERTESAALVLPIGVRLIAPLLVVFASLISTGAGSSPFFSTWNPIYRGYLLAGGIVMIAGWTIGYPQPAAESQDNSWSPVFGLLPAALGAGLISRGAAVGTAGPEAGSGIWIIGTVLVLLAGYGFTFPNPSRTWIWVWAGLGLASGLLADQTASLIFGGIMLLASLVLEGDRIARSPLQVLGIGIWAGSFLPYFPAWIGRGVLAGSEGFLLAAGAGLCLGVSLLPAFEHWLKSRPFPPARMLSRIPGVGVVFFTLLVISLRRGGLIDSPASAPVPVWIAPAVSILVLVGFGVFTWKASSGWVRILTQAKETLNAGLAGSVELLRQLVYLISRLFEGDGGLIWALLIGFLLVTLISQVGR